jgi:hypothetical protein
MPRATQRVVGYDAVDQRGVVVRAVSTHSKDFGAPARQKDLLAGNMAKKQVTILKLIKCHPLGQIGAVGASFILSHRFSPKGLRFRVAKDSLLASSTIGYRCAEKVPAISGNLCTPLASKSQSLSNGAHHGRTDQGTAYGSASAVRAPEA